MDLDNYKNRLLSEQENLKKEIAAYSAADPYQGDRSPVDYDDDISQMESHDRVAGTAAGLKEDLKKVEAALKRIEEGTYGICTNCGRKIDEGRLSVMPAAELCSICQSEKKGT